MIFNNLEESKELTVVENYFDDDFRNKEVDEEFVLRSLERQY